MPYTLHPLRTVYRRAGVALNVLLQQMPADEQFAVFSTVTVRDRVWAAQTEADNKYHGQPFTWKMMVGDLSNMYDALPYDAIDKGIAWMCNKSSTWTGKRTQTAVSVNKWGREARMGCNTAYDDHWVKFTLQELQDICSYDNSQSLVMLKGLVAQQVAGCPMGGFLSPAKANATCSQQEQLLLERRPEGIVMVLCRYMDDVFILAAYATEAEEKAIDSFCAYVQGGPGLEGGYPPPLELNVEPEAKVQYFLELQITVVGSRVDVMLYNKVVPALQKGSLQLSRLPDVGDASSHQLRRNWVVGYLHRIKAGCTDMGLARQAICTLAEELQHSAMLKYLVWGLAHVCRRDLDNGESDKFWIYVVGVTPYDGWI